MAADLFETYAVTVVATMVLASIFFAGTVRTLLAHHDVSARDLRRLHRDFDSVGTFFVKLGANNSIMGALYKGLIATGGALRSIGLAIATTTFVIGLGRGRRRSRASDGERQRTCSSAGIVGLIVTGLIVVITEYYTGTGKRPVVSIAQASVTGHGTNVIQGLAVSLESTALPALVIVVGNRIDLSAGRAVRDRDRGHHHARPRRHDRRARRVRPRDRQRRRHRRNGGSAEGSASLHRRARRRRQHHQGGDQGLRHRLGGIGRAGAVRRLLQRPRLLLGEQRQVPLFQRRPRLVRPVESLRRRRTHLWRHDPVSVRRHRHDGRRSRRWLRGGRSASPIQGNARHHAGHAAARLRPRGRPADQGGDQGNDHPVAAAGAGARSSSTSARWRFPAPRPTPSRRWGPRCLASSSTAYSSPFR